MVLIGISLMISDDKHLLAIGLLGLWENVYLDARPPPLPFLITFVEFFAIEL